MNYSIPPKFLFNNESDPHQMNISNNSNLTHSYIFQNFDANSISGRNKMNTSKPTEFNFDYQNQLKPNISNFTSNIIPKTDSRIPIEKDKNILISLTVKNSMNMSHNPSVPQIIDLNKTSEPLNLSTQKGK